MPASLLLVAAAFFYVSASGPQHVWAVTIFWTSDKVGGGGKIQSAQLGGSVQDLVTTGVDDPQNIAFDPAAGRMHWTDEGTDKIHRANLDGSNVVDVLSQARELAGLGLDLGAGKIYFSNRDGNISPDRIERADLDGSNIENLVSSPSISEVVSLALDVPNGKMYWTDPGLDKIQRANLDGSNVEDVLSIAPDGLGIALDLGAGKMYWTTGGPSGGFIQRANLDGSGVEDLVTGLMIPKGIALFDGKLYFADQFAGKIQRADLDGQNVEDLFTGLTSPKGIAVLSDIPEPSSIMLLLVGMYVVGFAVRTKSFAQRYRNPANHSQPKSTTVERIHR